MIYCNHCFNAPFLSSRSAVRGRKVGLPHVAQGGPQIFTTEAGSLRGNYNQQLYGKPLIPILLKHPLPK